MFCVRPLGDFDNCFVVILTAFQLLFRDNNIVNENVFGRNKVGKVAIYAQSSNETVFLPLQYFDDLCLFDVSLSACHEAHFHPVSVRCPHGIAFRNEDGRTAIVRQKRVLSIRFAHESALLYLPFCIESVGSIGHFRQEIVPSHLLHRVDCQHFQGVCI